MSTDTTQALVAAIRAFTVDLPDDRPNGEAERQLLVLGSLTDPASWPCGLIPGGPTAERLRAINEALARLCVALADDTQALREAAEGYFGGDFRAPLAADAGAGR